MIIKKKEISSIKENMKMFFFCGEDNYEYIDKIK